MAKQIKKAITFILLDDSIVTYGFRVLTDGVDLEQFKRNPVMLIDHNDGKLPIGKWENIRKEKGQILADACFDYEDVDPEVQRIIGKVERGVISMASAGLRDAQLSNDPSLKLEGQKLPTICQSRMREASIVSIGANHNALRLYDNNDNEIDLSDQIKLTDFINPNKPKTTMNEELLKALDLSDKADDKAVVTAIVALKDGLQTAQQERDDLQLKLDKIELADKENQKVRFAAEADKAVKEGRINAAGRDHLVKLHDTNPEEAEKFLASIPKTESVYSQISQAAKGSKTELKDMESKSWDELDKAGKLITLKDQDIDLYKTKFKEKFGKEPSI